MGNKLFTSHKAEEILQKLERLVSLEYKILARIAFAVSLSQDGQKAPKSIDFRGKEFNRYTLIGDNEVFYKSLLDCVYEKDISEDEYFANKSLFKDHIDNGCNILERMMNEVNFDKNDFLLKLISLIPQGTGIFPGENIDSYALNIKIGKNILKEEDVYIDLNNTKKHGNSHLAIMGKPGQGKTQILLNILAKIRELSGGNTNFIFFDYKHDGGIHDSNFLKVTQAKVFDLPNNKLPINPFILPNYDEKTIKLSAKEKADSFASATKGELGNVQKNSLQDIILECYADRKDSDKKFPDFHEVYKKAQEKYKADGKKADSLMGILRSLSDFDLFWDHKSKTQPLANVYQQTFVVDLSKLTALRELAAYLVIERLYKEMNSLPDSDVDSNGNRQIRTVLVIDEAHNYLSQKNVFLQKIIREGRSKGFVVFFASQSPHDYDQKEFDFKELLEFALILNSDQLNAGDIQRLIGCSKGIGNNLQDFIPKMTPFQMIMKTSENKDGYMDFLGDKFYEEYK